MRSLVDISVEARWRDFVGFGAQKRDQGQRSKTERLGVALHKVKKEEEVTPERMCRRRRGENSVGSSYMGWPRRGGVTRREGWEINGWMHGLIRKRP